MNQRGEASAEDQQTRELNQFVQNLLKQMQDRFDEMQNTIVGRIDEMGTHFLMKEKESTM